MKTCRFCLKEDLHDDARRCPHCGTWQNKTTRFFEVSLKVLAWVFLLVLILSLVTCVGGGLLT